MLLHCHPGGNPGADLKSISHRSYLWEVEFERELIKETIYLSQGGVLNRDRAAQDKRRTSASPQKEERRPTSSPERRRSKSPEAREVNPQPQTLNPKTYTLNLKP